MVYCHVAGHGQYKGRFSHARTCGKNDHVRTLPATCEFVQVMESRRHPTDPIFIVPCRLNVFQGLLHHHTHALVTLPDVALRHFKELGLRFVQQIEHIRRLVVRLFNDDIGHADQLPLDVFLGNDPRVKLDVGAAGHPSGQFCHPVAPTHHLQTPFFAQLLCDGQQIDGFRLVEQGLNGPEHLPVRLDVEAFRLQHIDHSIDGRFLDHHGTKDHFLKLLGLRLNLGARNHGRIGTDKVA